jgi:hypothetical protein
MTTRIRLFLRSLVAGAFLLGLVSTALASGTSNPSNTYSQVSLVYVTYDDGTHVMLASQNFPSSCADLSGGQPYFLLSSSDPQYAILHSTLMAAYAANKRVRLYWNGCGGDGGKYPLVKAIWVAN